LLIQPLPKVFKKETKIFLADSVSTDYKLKGIATSSQVCSAFYSAKQSAAPSQVSQTKEGDVSPSASDLNAPMPEPVFHHCNVITFAEPKKMGFYDLDWPSLERDFRSEENRHNRFIYFSFLRKRKRLIKSFCLYIYIYIYHITCLIHIINALTNSFITFHTFKYSFFISSFRKLNVYSHLAARVS